MLYTCCSDSVCSKELHPRYLNSTEVAAGLYFGPRPFSTCLTDPKIMCILVFSSDLILDCRFFTVRLYVLNQVKNYHIYILKYKTLYFYTVWATALGNKCRYTHPDWMICLFPKRDPFYFVPLFHYEPSSRFHTDGETLSFFQDRLFAFSPPTVFAVAETLLSCFLPSLSLKLANPLLICVGHNTGKQAHFLLHHFLAINTF